MQYVYSRIMIVVIIILIVLNRIIVIIVLLFQCSMQLEAPAQRDPCHPCSDYIHIHMYVCVYIYIYTYIHICIHICLAAGSGNTVSSIHVRALPSFQQPALQKLTKINDCPIPISSVFFVSSEIVECRSLK